MLASADRGVKLIARAGTLSVALSGCAAPPAARRLFGDAVIDQIVASATLVPVPTAPSVVPPRAGDAGLKHDPPSRVYRTFNLLLLEPHATLVAN